MRRSLCYFTAGAAHFSTQATDGWITKVTLWPTKFAGAEVSFNNAIHLATGVHSYPDSELKMTNIANNLIHFLFLSFFLLLMRPADLLAEGQQQLCPDSRLIQPCQCTSENNNIVSITCDQLQSVEQLQRIFEPAFPVNQLWTLVVKHSVLGDLEANLLGDKSFVAILFQNVSRVERILPHAFAASVERLRALTFDSSPELGILSVAGLADLENLVDFEVTSSIDHLTVNLIQTP